MERRRAALLEALVEVLRPRSIVERSEGPARRAEGLEPARGAVLGEAPAPFAVATPSGPMVVDLAGGQKTGLYLDQLANHRAVAALAAGRRVLDGFCNQGGFALAAALAGAAEVTGVDSSAAALALAARNAEAAGARATWVEANVFDHLRALDRERAVGRYDLFVLDPPPFAPNRRSVPGARRGYKELNLRALRLLEPGGLLSTFSCSHHIGRAELEEVLVEAAVDARRSVRVVAEHGQRADHPVLLGVPETRYLSGLTVAVVDAW
jgi:23S rRNA (cytosine1962-C5)-methyltransferase